MQANDVLCDLCQKVMHPLWSTRDTTQNDWSYVQCSSCNLIRLNTDLNKRWKDIAYPQDYYGAGYSKFSGAVQALRELSAYRRAQEIHRFFSAAGRVLDIGCGEGLFLKYMKRLGWDVQGCEIGKQAADRAEKILGQSIHRGEFETMPAPEKPWDMIMLWHVLEHVPKPLELLQKISAVTSKDGYLLIAIPNASSWQARLFGPNWFHLDPPRHLYSFDLSHLEKMALQTGWKIESVRHFSLEYNPYGWAQSLLNSLGWPRDAMYETLKRNRRFIKKEFLWRVLAWTLLGPSIIPAVLEAIAGRGGTMAVYLKKK